MHLANPGFLWALLFLALPIIIHLFKFRRYKTVYFPNIKFLKKLSEEQRSRRRLKDLLILISRLIALAALIIAFARPFLGHKGQAINGNLVSIYVDNSFSMENESEQGVLLDLARKKAEEIAQSFQPTDRFNLITNNLDPRHFRWVDRQTFLDFLYEVETSPRSLTLGQVYQNQLALPESKVGEKQWAFMVSDFQRNSVDLNKIDLDSSISLRMIPLQSTMLSNLSIDSVWFDSPIRKAGATEKLNFRIRNQSQSDITDVPLRLSVDDQINSFTRFSIAADSYKDSSLFFKVGKSSGYQEAALKLEDHPIVFDDHYLFSFEVKKNINICEIYAGPNPKSAYRVLFSDSLFVFESMNEKQIDYTLLENADLIVLNGLTMLSTGLISLLDRWLKNGGSLVINPSSNPQYLDDMNRLLSAYGVQFKAEPDTQKVQVSSMVFEDEIFQNVFEEKPRPNSFPALEKHYEVNTTDLNLRPLINLPGNDFLLARKAIENGHLFVFTIPLDKSWSNWSRHALFVTTLFKIAEMSINTPTHAYTIGSTYNIVINVDPDDQPLLELVSKPQNFAFVPEQSRVDGNLKLNLKNEILEQGFYKLMQKDSVYTSLAFNFSRKESEMDFYSLEELETFAASYSEASVLDVQGKLIKTNTLRDEKPLWKFFILTTLIFLILEIIIIKVMD